MEKKMFKTGMGKTIVGSIVLVMIILSFLGILIYFAMDTLYGKNILKADTYGDYVYIDALYLSKPFGEDESGGQYLFVTTEEGDKYHDYMLRLSKEDFNREDIQKLIRESYSPDAKPEILRLKGYMMESAQELDELAQQYYGQYVGQDVEDASEYLGSVVLDYSGNENILKHISLQIVLLWVFLLFVIIFGFIELIKTIRKQKKKSEKIELAKELFERDADYRKGMEEVNLPDTVFYKQCQCYITQNYVVTYQNGLEVFPISQIKELYGYDKTGQNMALTLMFGWIAGHRTHHYLVAVTSDNEVHMFADLTHVTDTHNQMVAQMIQKNHNITLGRNTTTFHDIQSDLPMLKLTKVPGFYGNADVWTGRTNDTFVVE